MSDFKFPCPKCGQNILCDVSNAGMNIQCPVCQAPLTVPPPPPPPPAANSPGKLSINKAVHHAPATAAAPGAGAKPAWGAKPKAPVKKKKALWKPILTYSIVVIVLIVGGVIGWNYYSDKKHKEEAAKEQAEAQAKAEAEKRHREEIAHAKAMKADWTTNLTDVDFPDRPASGRIHGINFTVGTTALQGGGLALIQTSGTVCEYIISLPPKFMQADLSQPYEVSPTNTANQPRIVIEWKGQPPIPPGAEQFSKGYAMKLEVEGMSAGKIPMKIYLSLPDKEHSYVAGNFQIDTSKMSLPPGVTAPARAQRAEPSAKDRIRRKLSTATGVTGVIDQP
jgi:hypothetical protein